MDVTELIAISNGDKNFVNEMLKLFIKGTNEGIQLIRKGYEEGNVQLVIEQAHKISSPCKHVGADKLYLLLKSIESEGRDSMSLDKLLPLIEKAEAEVESVIKEAEGLLPRTA